MTEQELEDGLGWLRSIADRPDDFQNASPMAVAVLAEIARLTSECELSKRVVAAHRKLCDERAAKIKELTAEVARLTAEVTRLTAQPGKE